MIFHSLHPGLFQHRDKQIVCAMIKQRRVFCIYSRFRLNAEMYGWNPVSDIKCHRISLNFFLSFGMSQKYVLFDAHIVAFHTVNCYFFSVNFYFMVMTNSKSQFQQHMHTTVTVVPIRILFTFE